MAELYMQHSNRFDALATIKKRRARTCALLAFAAMFTSSQCFAQSASAPSIQKPSHPRIESITSMRAPAAAAPKHKSSYDFTIPATGWFDTGITLAAGERVAFTATGAITLPDHRTPSPDGLPRGWKDLLRVFPLNSANAGALIARISDISAAVPILIGTTSEITVATTGRLFLRANLAAELEPAANTTPPPGNFKVKLKFEPAVRSIPLTLSATTPPAALDTLLSTQIFANIPRRVSDHDSAHEGNQGDMVNFALLGTEAQLDAAFKAAGWVAVDQSVEDAVIHGLLSTLSHQAYTEMPMSTLYLFGRPQDKSFARGDPLQVAAIRHHLRIWKTDQLLGGLPLWVGSATHDHGFEKDKRNGNITHHIDAAIDDERDFLLHSFDATGGFQSAAYLLPDNPFAQGETATGGAFHSDGRILVMQLK